MDIQIRPANTDDANAIRDIFREVIQDGTSYASHVTTEKAIHSYCFPLRQNLCRGRPRLFWHAKLMPAFPDTVRTS